MDKAESHMRKANTSLKNTKGQKKIFKHVFKRTAIKQKQSKKKTECVCPNVILPGDYEWKFEAIFFLLCN